jgi:hypothetical protein
MARFAGSTIDLTTLSPAAVANSIEKSREMVKN